MTTGKITIKANIPEQVFMESLLNIKHSGVGTDILIPLSFYALANGWHYNKLNYYLNLLEIKNEKK